DENTVVTHETNIKDFISTPASGRRSQFRSLGCAVSPTNADHRNYMDSAWDKLKGHQEQRDLFSRSLANRRLSHAYVLAGQDGIGKSRFGRLLAQSLFCRNSPPESLDACGECRACRSFDAGSWPDYIEVGLPPGKNEIPIAAIAGSAEKRGREGLCFELSMTPQASERRIAIINDAHRMNAEGANALLKTLEEPPAQALILLISDSPDSLLPTIRSRCQVVRFFPLSTEDTIQILLNEEMTDSEQEAGTVAEVCNGSITSAQQLLNPELRELRNTLERGLIKLEKLNPIETSREITNAIEKMSSGTDEQRQNTQWMLRFLGDLLNQQLRKLTQGDLADPLHKRFGVRSGADLVADLLDRVLTASFQIDANSPVKLVLETLFDDLARMMRIGPTSAR
ncbi:MAG: DNA polymerase III subunit delta', partial [Planctomycetaceae bacterium]